MTCHYELDSSAFDTAAAVIAENGTIADEQLVNVILKGDDSRATSISFDVFSRFDRSDESASIEDLLNVYLVSSNFSDRVLLDNGTDSGALFSLIGDQAEFPGGRVRFDGKTVEIDRTGLPEHVNNADLLFQLVDLDGDDGTQIAIGPINRNFGEGESPALLRDIAPFDPGEAIDLGGLSFSSNLEVQLENLKFQSQSGILTAELRVESLRGNSGGEVAVRFDDLPAGVQLLNASGTTNDGAPYLNLSDAIPAGGLNVGEQSDFVSLSIETPGLEKFTFAPKIFTGSPNSAPAFPAINQVTVMPGGVEAISLMANDADGDPISYSLIPTTDMPTVSLDANGILQIRPQVNELGLIFSKLRQPMDLKLFGKRSQSM